jgi:Flp pilus assembly protein TadD
LRRLLLVLLAAGAACQRPSSAPPAVTRLAILPPENLSGDPRLDWVSRAVQVVLANALEGGSPFVVSEAARALDLAGDAVSTVACRYTRYQARLILECWRDQAENSFYGSSHEEGVHDLAVSAAQFLSPQTRNVAPVKPEAVRALGEGRPEDAAALDPTFGPAWVEAVERKKQQDPTAARQLAENGLGVAVLGPVIHARLELARASLDGDRSKQLAAFEKLIAATAPDPARLEALAGLQSDARRIADAARTQERVTELAPANPLAWNQLAYLRAAAGDLAGAQTAVARYRELQPESPNPYDSQGEIEFLYGRFADAEKSFLEAVRIQPEFNGGQAVFKAAWARAMQGDRAAADQQFERYVSSRPEAERPWIREQWAASFGSSEALIAGLKSSRQVALAAAPPARRLGLAMSAFVTQPIESPEDWRQRAEQAFPGPQFTPVRDFLVVTALLINQNYAAAEPLARQVLNRTNPLADGRSRVLLAWALDGLGRAEEARELLKLRVIPNLGPSDTLGPLLTARERELRAKLGL